MAEVREESTHVYSHKARIALFLSAMRHFRDRPAGPRHIGHYHALDTHAHPDYATVLAAGIRANPPREVVMLQAGDARLQSSIEATVAAASLTLQIHADPHFLCDGETFNDWLDGRKQPRLEHFYRFMRRRTGILMEDGQPQGGKWNFDAANRKTFDQRGPRGHNHHWLRS